MTVLIVDDQPDVVRGEEQGIDWPKLGIDTILTAYSVPEAEELLLSKRVEGTDIPVSLIALKTGYANFSYFSQVFRRHTGCSPLEYRQQKGKHDSRP